MIFDYTICKLCGKGGNAIRYKLRMADVVVCNHCQFHYTTYQDDEYANVSAHSEKEVLDDIAVQYIQQKLESNAQRFDHHLKVVKTFSGNAGKLLDIGFGGAVFLRKAKELGFDTYGIELDKQYILYAQQVLQLENVYQIPLQDAFWQQKHASFFDAVVLWDVIEHVNDPKQMLEQIAVVMRRGGKLYIDTPCRDAFYHRFSEWLFRVSGGRFKGFLHDMYSSHRFGHKQILSKKDVQTIFNAAGFKLIELKLFHELSFPYSFYLKKILKRDALVSLVLPLVKLFFKVIPIKNKMMVVAEKA